MLNPDVVINNLKRLVEAKDQPTIWQTLTEMKILLAEVDRLKKVEGSASLSARPSLDGSPASNTSREMNTIWAAQSYEAEARMLSGANENLAKALQDAEKKHREETIELRLEVDRLKQRVEELRQERNQQSQLIHELRVDLATAKADAEKWRNKPASLLKANQVCDRLEAKINFLHKENDRLKENFDQLNRKRAELVHERDQLKSAIKNMGETSDKQREREQTLLDMFRVETYEALIRELAHQKNLAVHQKDLVAELHQYRFGKSESELAAAKDVINSKTRDVVLLQQFNADLRKKLDDAIDDNSEQRDKLRKAFVDIQTNLSKHIDEVLK